MFLRAKVHFFSEKPKLSDENCKNYQELLIYLSGRHLTRGSWYPQPASKQQKTSPAMTWRERSLYMDWMIPFNQSDHCNQSPSQE